MTGSLDKIHVAQNDALITLASGEALTIKIFQHLNCYIAPDAGAVSKVLNRHAAVAFHHVPHDVGDGLESCG